jgi:hypothetical protein
LLKVLGFLEVSVVDSNCAVYDNDTWKKVHKTVYLEDAFYEFDIYLPENDFALFQILKISDEIEYHCSIYFLHIETVEKAKKQVDAFVESMESEK